MTSVQKQTIIAGLLLLVGVSEKSYGATPRELLEQGLNTGHRYYLEDVAQQDSDMDAKAEAQKYLGDMWFFDGETFKSKPTMSYEHAFNYYQAAAYQSKNEAVQRYALYCLARCYFHGKGVQKNERLAADYFARVLEKGSDTAIRVESACCLGKILFHGLGYVSKNKKLAQTYFTFVVESTDGQGDSKLNKYKAQASCYLGKIFYHGYPGQTRDFNKAYNYFTSAATQNSDFEAQAWAYVYLGKIHYDRIIYSADIFKAREYFHPAANQTSSLAAKCHALVCLGKMYLFGVGEASKDEAKARNYFEQAAALGMYDQIAGVKAGDYLKYMYYYGLGVAVDIKRRLRNEFALRQDEAKSYLQSAENYSYEGERELALHYAKLAAYQKVDESVSNRALRLVDCIQSGDYWKKFAQGDQFIS